KHAYTHMADLTDRPIAILGAGSWGTALAYSLALHGGHAVRLWARRADLVETIRRERRNLAYLPNVVLPERVAVTSDIGEAVAESALVVVATPSQSVRPVAGSIADRIGPEHVVVSVAKGIEVDTLLTTTQVLRDVLPNAAAERI